MITETIGFCRQKITISHANENEILWPRGIDAVVCRLPSDSPPEEGDVEFVRKVDESLGPSGWFIGFVFSPQKNKTRVYEIAQAAKDTNLKLVDIITTIKPWWGGQKADSHLICTYEHVLLFTKAKRWALNRNAIGPILLNNDTSLPCPGNSWHLAKYSHSEIYPPEVAAALLKMVELLPGSVVLDPLMGGSSGLTASLECGHSFIGFEPKKAKFDSYPRIIKKIEKRMQKRDIDQSKGILMGGTNGRLRRTEEEACDETEG